MSERPTRRRTATSTFGVGRREAHDAAAFYARFEAPELSKDDRVAGPAPLADPFVCGDARHMDAIEDASVALVVTSPSNIVYLTNFTGSSAILVLTPDRVVFLTDFRYLTVIEESRGSDAACPGLDLHRV